MRWLLVLVLGVLIGAFGYHLLFSTSPLITINRSTPAPPSAGPDQDPDKPLPATTPDMGPSVAPPEGPSPAPAEPAPTMAPVPPPAGLLQLPVQGLGADKLEDTFTQARGQGRLHDAIDIMATAGTPVLAVADGKVEKLFTSDRGGLTLYQFEPSGKYAYYYAHLQRYAEGLAQGQSIKRGQVIGYVGSTGNANPEAPHLHFAIFLLGPERRWWEGTAVNPYPLLTGRQALPQ